MRERNLTARLMDELMRLMRTHQWNEEIFHHLSRYSRRHPYAGLAPYLDRYQQSSSSSCSYDYQVRRQISGVARMEDLIRESDCFGAQYYVRQWARMKGLKIDTDDLAETA